MCLALPGRILEIKQESDLREAEIDFSGVKKSACLVYTPEAKVGDYVIVHVGFAITVLNEEQAQSTLALIDSIKT